MDFTNVEIAKSIVKFLAKNEKYRVIKSDVSQNLLYLVTPKKDKKFSIVRIFAQDDRNIVEVISETNKIEEGIRKFKREAVKTLTIVIDSTKNEVSGDEILKTIICGEKDIRTNLEPYFPNISLMTIKKIKVKETIKREIETQDDEIPNSIEELKKQAFEFNKNLKAGSLISSWVIVVLFIFLPIIFSFLALNYQVNTYSTTLGLSSLPKLVTGGTNFILTIDGQQWWRILTYGFAVNSSSLFMNLLFIAVCGFGLFSVLRLSENIVGKVKMIFIFALSYVLTGLFVSVMLPVGTVSGGILPVLAIMSGILMMRVSGSKNFKAVFAKNKLIWPIVLLIMSPLLLGESIQYITVIVGFSIGGMFSMLFKTKPFNWDWTYIFPILILVTLLVLPLVYMSLPRYISALDYTTLWTIRLYAQLHFITGAKGANSIINTIGWSEFVHYSTDSSGYISFVIF